MLQILFKFNTYSCGDKSALANIHKTKVTEIPARGKERFMILNNKPLGHISSELWHLSQQNKRKQAEMKN